jgi:copper chaperone CopZ
MTVREYEVSNLSCADCGNKIEAGIQALSNVNRANLDFMAKKLTVEYHEKVDNPLIMLNSVAASIDPAVEISEAGDLSRKKKRFSPGFPSPLVWQLSSHPSSCLCLGKAGWAWRRISWLDTGCYGMPRTPLSRNRCFRKNS